MHLPRELQRKHPGEVLVLSERAFFYPSWIHLRVMYDEDDGYDYKASAATMPVRARRHAGKGAPRRSVYSPQRSVERHPDEYFLAGP